MTSNISCSRSLQSRGMLATEYAFDVLHEGSTMETYWDNLKKSWVWEELHKARNYHPAFEYGLIPGLALSVLEKFTCLRLQEDFIPPVKAASLHTPIPYLKPDGVVSLIYRLPYTVEDLIPGSRYQFLETRPDKLAGACIPS